jgi:hypothetical protein
MVNRPKQIGTAGETAVVRYVRTDGFPGAERLALHGTLDEGDATLCPGVGAEVKSGHAAETASDALVATWLDEAETERVNRGADIMLLVLKRKGKGAASAGRWFVHLPGWVFIYLSTQVGGLDVASSFALNFAKQPAVRITLAEACTLLRRAGYGDAL